MHCDGDDGGLNAPELDSVSILANSSSNSSAIPRPSNGTYPCIGRVNMFEFAPQCRENRQRKEILNMCFVYNDNRKKMLWSHQSVSVGGWQRFGK